MRRDLRQQRLLVTGASSGIGRQVAEQAARRGARVMLVARSSDKLDEAVRTLRAEGCDVLSHTADVTSPADRQGLVDAVKAQWGGLDVLFNVAGVSSFGHFLSGTEDVLRKIMEVNFFAPAEMMRICFPLLKDGNNPAVVNVASMCGRRALPAFGEYSASKFALVGLTEALRAEAVLHKVRFLLVLPGLTKTGLGATLLRNEGKMPLNFDDGMPVEEVGRGIIDALVRDRTETIMGWESHWILWMTRFFPRFVDWVIARRVRRLYAGSK